MENTNLICSSFPSIFLLKHHMLFYFNWSILNSGLTSRSFDSHFNDSAVGLHSSKLERVIAILLRVSFHHFSR
ncbi:hypothetical protein RhiirA4_155468 [Rhizophagus irregularis]|uniref:Uncharacterized protein n=1 Tax=Rhizophagus irregularis TaxID=588596 RepID=A0A2I1GDY4_9GLOM|nr:hypothetical protein RhiirA4_155468 [Rhizophagus irregularis]